MVAKMKYISITGHMSKMNHVVNRYLGRYEIQLEQSTHSMMEPFTTLNPYAQTLRKAEMFGAMWGVPPILHVPMVPAEAVNLVEAAAVAYDQRDDRLRELEGRLVQIQEYTEVLGDFSRFETELITFVDMEFIHFRFGCLTLEHYRRFERFIREDKRILFTSAHRDREYVHGVYFTPEVHRDEVDAVFASLEWLDKTETVMGCVREFSEGGAIFHALSLAAAETEEEISRLTQNALAHVAPREKLSIACAKVKNLYAAFDVKKYAAISRGRRVFTFSGWMKEQDADELEAEIARDDYTLFTRHIHGENQRPPVILKNLPIVRQFEFFTRLYGLPEYGEVDPTLVLAITYTLLFGLMFGDIGHGLALAVLGVVIKKVKPGMADLGGIMTVVGMSAAFFGVLYGSVFGFEFTPLWRRPTGNITETLILAAGLGVGLIALSMFINMYNSFRQGRIGDMLFGANGAAGLMFYGTLLWLLVRLLAQGRGITGTVAAVALLPLVIICMKHPLENFIAGKPLPRFFRRGEAAKTRDVKHHGSILGGSVGQFFGNMLIEVFETLLTYATNTISFVRVGAFAVSHVGMMHVVLQLSRGAAGAGNILILVIGNVLVMVIEGLLVGIQVLRLDFYELFSRFYKGGGREFKPAKYL